MRCQSNSPSFQSSKTTAQLLLILLLRLASCRRLSTTTHHHVSSSQLPPHLSLIDYSTMFYTEGPADFFSNFNDGKTTATIHGNSLFDDAVSFEWNRILAHNVKHDNNMKMNTTIHQKQLYPFCICHSEPNKSGHQRMSDIHDAFVANDNDNNTISLTPLYDKSIRSCFLLITNGRHVIQSYHNTNIITPQEMKKQYITVNPLTQSLKMGPDTVEQIQKQLESHDDDDDERNRYGFDDVIPMYAFFAVKFLPGVISSGADDDDETRRGRRLLLNSTTHAHLITRELWENPEKGVSLSFFYQRVMTMDDDIGISDTNNGDDTNTTKLIKGSTMTNNIFRDDVITIKPTKRILFWAEALSSGLLSGLCEDLITPGLEFIHWPRLPDTVLVSVTLGDGTDAAAAATSLSSTVERACVWSLVQGFALHSSTCFIQAMFPLDEDNSYVVNTGH